MREPSSFAALNVDHTKTKRDQHRVYRRRVQAQTLADQNEVIFKQISRQQSVYSNEQWRKSYSNSCRYRPKRRQSFQSFRLPVLYPPPPPPGGGPGRDGPGGGNGGGGGGPGGGEPSVGNGGRSRRRRPWASTGQMVYFDPSLDIAARTWHPGAGGALNLGFPASSTHAYPPLSPMNHAAEQQQQQQQGFSHRENGEEGGDEEGGETAFFADNPATHHLMGGGGVNEGSWGITNRNGDAQAEGGVEGDEFGGDRRGDRTLLGRRERAPGRLLRKKEEKAARMALKPLQRSIHFQHHPFMLARGKISGTMSAEEIRRVIQGEIVS